MNHPLTPFVDKLAVPPRHVVGEPTRLAVRLEPAMHRFHRDLPPSPVWAYDGSVPGPTVGTPRCRPEVFWENRLGGPFPIVVAVAPDYAWDALIRSSCKSIGSGTRLSLCTPRGDAAGVDEQYRRGGAANRGE
jgi:hypothetical protein